MTLTWTALSFCTTSRLEQYAGYTDVVWTAASLSNTSLTLTAYYSDDVDSFVSAPQAAWNSMLAMQMLAGQLLFV